MTVFRLRNTPSEIPSHPEHRRRITLCSGGAGELCVVSSYRRTIACRREVEPRAARLTHPVQYPPALHDLVALIGCCINEVSAAGLRETATLLSIAQLDLRARLSGLTEVELSAVTSLSCGEGDGGN